MKAREPVRRLANVFRCEYFSPEMREKIIARITPFVHETDVRDVEILWVTAAQNDKAVLLHGRATTEDDK